MKIALVQCPAFGIDRPPIALAYLAAILKKNSYELKCFDFNIDLYSNLGEENKKFWDYNNVYCWLDENHFLQTEEILGEKCDKWLSEIMSFNPDVIGFSVQSSSLAYSIRLAKLIKKASPGKIIIFGGPITSTHSLGHNSYLLQVENDANSKIVDIVVVGEGELTLLELLDRLKSKNNFEDCKGALLMRKEGILNNGSRDYINNLDDLAFPDFSDFVLSKYNNGGLKLPILGSRGCTHRCIFCDDTVIWGKYRFRSARNVFEEMKLRKAQGVKFLDFNDLLINGNYRQLNDLCDLLIKEKINVLWGASASVDKYLNFKLLRKLKLAGCAYLNYGIESASPEVLKDMGKSFSIQDAERVIKCTYKAKINVCTNWIIGFPTETEEDFEKTLRFIRKNYKYIKDRLMVNSFMVKSSSLLYNCLTRFSVVFDQDNKWSICDKSNTEEIRKKRYMAFLNEVNRLKGEVAHSTFHG